MVRILVWAFKPLPELNNQTGFVECDDELARRLIAQGSVQDLADGGHALKAVEPATPAPHDGPATTPLNAPGTYKTTEVTPPPRGGSKKRG